MITESAKIACGVLAKANREHDVVSLRQLYVCQEETAIRKQRQNIGISRPSVNEPQGVSRPPFKRRHLPPLALM